MKDLKQLSPEELRKLVKRQREEAEAQESLIETLLLDEDPLPSKEDLQKIVGSLHGRLRKMEKTLFNYMENIESHLSTIHVSILSRTLKPEDLRHTDRLFDPDGEELS